MQDYNYIWAQCLELTLEVSCCKFPPVDELPGLWMENREALLAFIKQVHLGEYLHLSVCQFRLSVCLYIVSAVF